MTVVTVTMTLTVRALPAFLMLSSREVDSSYGISFESAWKVITATET